MGTGIGQWFRRSAALGLAIVLVLFTNAETSVDAFRAPAAAQDILGGEAYGGAFSVPAAVDVITVTTLDDISDLSGAQQVGDLPGPDGRVSFREAVTAANNTQGPQTIAFAIPTSEFWLLSNVALLKIEENAFFLNDSGTTVDFSTQAVNIGDTNPDGPEVGMYGLEPNAWGVAAIFVNADNCVIKGLGKVYQRGYAVEIGGDNNRVIASQISGPIHAAINIEGYGTIVPTGNIIGGTGAGEGNTLSGLTIRGPADGNIVIGNIVIGGVDVVGATQYGVFTRNNRIGGPTPAERNVIAGAGRYGEEGFPVGEQVSVVDADGTVVEGNYIGTTADGMARYPQQIGPIGVDVYDSRGTTVRGNLISGLRTVGTNHYAGQVFGQAIRVGASNKDTQDTLIEDNTIGLAADGTTPIVTRAGIAVIPLIASRHAFDTRIASNHVAGVETTGVQIGSQENGITITQNDIHDSGGLGIDLLSGFSGVGGVTANDPGDVDEGGNGLQNFPVIVSAVSTGTSATIEGTLDTVASEQFTIELFTSAACDPSGFGEGARFLSSVTVATDSSGHAAFSTTIPARGISGTQLTATGTRVSTGDTSEFSRCVAVTPRPAVTLRTAFDMNADRKSDVGIFRPSNGTWYVLDGDTGTSDQYQFGVDGDIPQDADIDGDLKADHVVWRSSTGQWFWRNSSDGKFGGAQWGVNGDRPSPGDYDGDGKTDIAVWRPSNGLNYIIKSSGGFLGVQWGASGDIPAHTDLNGDGKTDFAVFRPLTGTWYTLVNGTSTTEQLQFGTNGDIPVRGDFDGDQKGDIALWRPSTGEWFYRRSSNLTFGGLQWGANGDRPVPGDYDGDGLTDFGVWRSSDGTNYIVKNSGGFLGVVWGAAGDIPVLGSPVP